jgi:quinol monooxygenase YgiN/uncharacterized protein YndB with AHSA1/START domain
VRTIVHTVEINGTREAVHAALTTIDGLAGWWTPTVAGNPVAGGVIDFTFGGDFNPDMRVDDADADKVAWTCVGGHDNWAANVFTFELRGTAPVRLRFTQQYARELEIDVYGTYNFNWGYYLDSLRMLVETGNGKPFGIRQAPDAAGFVSIAKATARPERADTLTDELRARVLPTRAQPGSLGFQLLRPHDDPNTIVAVEHWRSREDWQQHLEGGHVTSLMAVFETTLAEPPDIVTYEPVS